MSDKPFTLPKYTFIVNGTKEERRALMLAIAERDPNLLVDALEEPLTVASAMLFWDVRSPNLREAVKNSLPFPHTVGDFDDWIEMFLEALKSFAGPLALAHLAIPRIEEAADFAARFIFIDAQEDEVLKHLITYFGVDSCLVLSIGKRSEEYTTLPSIPLFGTLEEQLTQLGQSLQRLPL